MENSICSQTDIMTIEVDHLLNLSASLKALRQTNTLTDVTLICGDQWSDAHRLILSAISPYFYSALTKGWTETSSRLVNLPATSALNLETILTFAYTGCLNDAMGDPGTLMDILENANYFLMESLEQFSFQALAALQLTNHHFLEMFDYVEALNNPKLVSQVATCLAINFSEIRQANEFVLLKKGQMAKLLTNSALANADKKEVFEGLLRWTEAESERQDDLNDFLVTIFENYCTECANDLVEKSVPLIQNVDIIPILREFLDMRSQIRMAAQNLLFFGNISSGSVVTMYYVQSNEWSQTVALPFYVESGMDMATHRCHTYFFGGGGDEADIIPSTAVIKYCPFSNTKLASAPKGLISPVYDAEVAVVDDFIYIVNGVDKDYVIQKTVQRYNPANGTCHVVASTNFGHYSPTVLPFNKGLYIVGSFNTDKFVEYYDPAVDQWTVVTEIPGSVVDCVAALCDSKLYVIRECFETAFYIYDICSGVWSVQDFDAGPSRVNWLWAVSIRDQSTLIVCDLDNSDNVVFQYNIESECWAARSSRNTAMGDVSNCCCTDMMLSKCLCINVEN